MINYINRSNDVYAKLAEYTDTFEKEALVINYVKCAIANGRQLESGNYNGIIVSLMKNNDGYVALFEGYRLEIKINGIEIVDISFTVV